MMTSKHVAAAVASKDATIEIERAKVSNVMDRLRERTQYLEALMRDMIKETRAGDPDKPGPR